MPNPFSPKMPQPSKPAQPSAGNPFPPNPNRNSFSNFTKQKYGSLDLKDVSESFKPINYDPKVVERGFQGLPTAQKEQFRTDFSLSPYWSDVAANAKKDFNEIVRGVGTIAALAIQTFAQDMEEAGKRGGDPDRISWDEFAGAAQSRAWKMVKGTPTVAKDILVGTAASVGRTFSDPKEAFRAHPILTVMDATMMFDLLGKGAFVAAEKAGVKAAVRKPFVPSVAKVTTKEGAAFTDLSRVVPQEYARNYYRMAGQWMKDKAIEKTPVLQNLQDHMFGAREAVRMIQGKQALKYAGLARYQKAWDQALEGFDDEMMGTLRNEFELWISKKADIAAAKAKWDAPKLARYEAGADTAKKISRNYEQELIDLGFIDDMQAAKSAWLAEAQYQGFVKPGEKLTDDKFAELMEQLPDVVKEMRPVRIPIKRGSQLIGEGKIVEDAAGKPYVVQGVYTVNEKGAITSIEELTEARARLRAAEAELKKAEAAARRKPKAASELAEETEEVAPIIDSDKINALKAKVEEIETAILEAGAKTKQAAIEGAEVGAAASKAGSTSKKWVVLGDPETGATLPAIKLSDLKKTHVLQDEITWYNKTHGPTYWHHEAVRDAATFKGAMRALFNVRGTGGQPGAFMPKKYGPYDVFAKNVPRGFVPEPNVGKAQMAAIRDIEGWKTKGAIIKDTTEKFAKPVGPSGAPDAGYTLFNPSATLRQAAVNMKVMERYAARLAEKRGGVIQALDDTFESLTDDATRQEILKEVLPTGKKAATDEIMQIPNAVADELRVALGIHASEGNAVARVALQFHDDIISAMRYSQLALSPRWVIGNAKGNAVLSATAGHFGWTTAWIPGTKRNRLIKQGIDEGLFPEDVIGKSLAKSELDVPVEAVSDMGLGEFARWLSQTKPGKFVKAWGNTVMGVNRRVEAYSRANVYLDKIADEAVKGNVIKMMKKWAMLDTLGAQLDELRRVAKDPALTRKYIDYTNKVLFDYSNMTVIEKEWFRRAFMYWTWQKSITRRFWELPIKEPVKFRLLSQMAVLAADAIRQENEPDWMMDTARLFTDPKTGETELWSLRSSNPFESAFVPTEEGAQRLGAQINPVLKTFMEWASGMSYYKGRKYQGPSGDEKPSLAEIFMRNFPQYELLESAIMEVPTPGQPAGSAPKLWDSVGFGQILATKAAMMGGNPDAINWIAIQGENGELIEKPFPKKLAGLILSIGTFSQNMSLVRQKEIDRKRAKFSKIMNNLIIKPSKRNPEKWDKAVEWFQMLPYDPVVEWERALDEFNKDFEDGEINIKSFKGKRSAALRKYKDQTYIKNIKLAPLLKESREATFQ